MNPTTYPTSPKNLPTDFLKLPKSYQSRVLIVLLALILFVLLYFAFIAGAAFLLYLSVIYPMESVGFYPLLIKLGAIIASGMLLIFTLKFAFKKMRYDRPTSVELKEKEHPSLFAFIRKLCEETGAPFPKKIIVNEEINAAVFYDKPLLSMFLPIRKNLLIGLGLVNALNLTEFKAVLAHEFGHFSQRSMKLGSYVYMANRIIHDMVYSRDKWDDMLDQWARADIRVAVFAWILKGIIWIVRGGLTLVYKGINLVHASLSREMEFNADLVAVSVTGSNAIINALAKIIGASNAMNLTYSQIMTAAEHNLYTKDLFYHQVKAEAHLNTTSKPQETTWEKDGITYIFDQEETMIPSMYASHPPNYDREQNAKRTFIEGIEDQQSAWTLFDNDEALKQLITSKIYEQSALNPKNEPLQEAAIVDDFIQGEIQETTYHERYCGTYDARYLHIMPLEEAKTKVSEHFASKEAALEELSNLYNEDLAEAMKQREAWQAEVLQLQNIAQTIGKKKQFQYQGETYQTTELEELYEAKNQLIVDQYKDWFKSFDHRVQVTYLALCQHFDLAEQAELEQRYDFHDQIQFTYQALDHVHQYFQESIAELQQYRELDEHLVTTFEDKFNNARNRLAEVLEEVVNVPIPAFKFIEDEPMLKDFLLETAVIRGGSNVIGQFWLTKLSEQISTALNRANRLYHKSLGNLIRLQEEVEKEVKLF